MEIQGILKNLREKNNLTQEQLAERVQVTRQAVSRWETGETQPNTDTLKLLSRVFDVSINTLLGSPRQLVCQCCGMPLNEDGLISREPDGSYNEDYYFLRQPQRVIGVHIGRTRSTAGRHIQLALQRLRRLMEGKDHE